MKEKKAKKNQEQHDETRELFENPEVLQEKLSESQEFIDKNKNVILGALVAVVLIIGGYFAYGVYIDKQDDLAQAELSPAVFYLEKDSIQQALEGDGNFTIGFKAISEEYSGTKAANLAYYYAGVSYMKTGEYAQAIEALKNFSSKDLIVQARAFAMIGDAYVEEGNLGEAISYLQKAADYKENEHFTPIYLMKLAFVQEANNDVEGAKATYEKVITDFGKTQDANDAKKFLAKLNASSAK